MSEILNPETWIAATGEQGDYIYECLEENIANRFDIVQTDDGWAIRPTVRVSSGAVSKAFLLPESVQSKLDELHEACEQLLVWDTGLGLQMTVEL